MGEISCPVMAFSSEDDRTVDAMSSFELMSLLNSSVRIHKMYGPGVPHVLTLEGNPYRGTMFALTAHFVQDIEKSISPRRVR